MKFNINRVKTIIVHSFLEFDNDVDSRYFVYVSGKYLSGSRFSHLRLNLNKAEYRDLQLRLLLN